MLLFRFGDDIIADKKEQGNEWKNTQIEDEDELLQFSLIGVVMEPHKNCWRKPQNWPRSPDISSLAEHTSLHLR